jgi:uncharacterized protein (DUF4213/DUF364 family)
MTNGILERTQRMLRRPVLDADLIDLEVSVYVKPLTPEEAIGEPGRRDFPILVGKERVIEARVGQGRGHAFTDTAREYVGPLTEVIALPLDENGRRAIFIATMNATLRHLSRIEGTVHCRDEDPERCGTEIARRLAHRFGEPVVGLIGNNPAIAEHLIRTFGPDRVRITDLNPENIGKSMFGVTLWNGATQTNELIDAVDVALVTGTTMVNGSFDRIWEQITYKEKIGLIYGVTASGVCGLLGFERICPYARNG